MNTYKAVRESTKPADISKLVREHGRGMNVPENQLDAWAVGYLASALAEANHERSKD